MAELTHGLEHFRGFLAGRQQPLFGRGLRNRTSPHVQVGATVHFHEFEGAVTLAMGGWSLQTRLTQTTGGLLIEII